MTTGWKLDRANREELLVALPPRYARTIADHVTVLPNSRGGADADLPPLPGSAHIIGRADDDAGVEALVVRIDGSTTRPDGATWHITWSLAEGREAQESNAVIAERGWAALGERPVVLISARW